MKAFRDWDLACKINAAILLFLLVAGGLIGGVLYWKTRQILSEEVDTSARAAVRLAAERINRDFPVVEAAAQELALSIELLRPDEAQQKAMIRATLERLRKSVPALCGISIAYIPYGADPESRYYMLYTHVNKAGEIEVARIGGEEYQYFKFDWFTIPQLLDRAVWTEPYLDLYADILMSPRSQPIRDAGGKFIGMTGFDLSLEAINAQVVAADVYGYGQEFLISRFGRFVAFPEDPAHPYETKELRDEAAHLSQSTIFSYADLLRAKMFSGDDASGRLRQIGQEMLRGRGGTDLLRSGFRPGMESRCRLSGVPADGAAEFPDLPHRAGRGRGAASLPGRNRHPDPHPDPAARQARRRRRIDRSRQLQYAAACAERRRPDRQARRSIPRHAAGARQLHGEGPRNDRGARTHRERA